MKVQLQLFAGASEAAGCDSIALEIPEGATYADLAAELVAVCPVVQPVVEVSRFAAATEYVEPHQLVDPQAELALIPPVSGG